MEKQLSKSLGRLILGLTVAALLFVLGMTITFVVADHSGGKSKSAYDIAVDNGFTGTEQEWLDSLQTGTVWHSGKGLPSNDMAGVKEGDYYVNENTNSVYRFTGGAWSFMSNMGGSTAISPWDGTIPGWQNPNLSPEEIVKNRPVSYVVNDTAKTVEIYNADAFAWFAYRSVIGAEGYDGWTVSLKSDIDLGNKMWVPTGLGARSNADAVSFKGTFDGEGHTIYNLSSKGFYDAIQYGTFTNARTGQQETGWYIHYVNGNVNVDIALGLKADDNADEFSFGLFGTTYNATIQNLNIENITIDLAKKTVNEGTANAKSCIGDSAGAIVGYAQGDLTMENCRVGYSGCTGTITGAKCAGGIVGRFYGGYEGDGKVQKDPQTQAATYDQKYYGKIAIKNCTNYLNVGVAGIDKKAGIIGFAAYFSGVTIENCVNYGDIVGVDAGGIIGFRGSGTNPAHGAMTLTNCTNYGKITGVHAGGILGLRYSQIGGSALIPFFTFRNCNNYGDIEGKLFGNATGIEVGGLVGVMTMSKASGVFLDCFNYGKVSSSLGDLQGKKVTLCVGGLFGRLEVGDQKFVLSGGTSGSVSVTYTNADNASVANVGVTFGKKSANEKFTFPYGEIIATGTATLNGTPVTAA